MQEAPKWEIKPFEALSAAELYECLFLRSDVFIKEQNCVYNDVDNKDQKALHLYGILQGEIVAYARLFKPNDYFEEASIGRVVVRADQRDKNLGHELMDKAIEAIAEHFGKENITISAQLYLKKFYESHQFVAVGESYLEDDIPHIRMKRN
ncbi:MAG TPA: GNAT family N-acetyltransferase [Flavobacterium sp.]|jgi:ElaA protein